MTTSTTVSSNRVLSTLLEIGSLEWNPSESRTIGLTHGWTDAPATWQIVSSQQFDG